MQVQQYFACDVVKKCNFAFFLNVNANTKQQLHTVNLVLIL